MGIQPQERGGFWIKGISLPECEVEDELCVELAKWEIHTDTGVKLMCHRHMERAAQRTQTRTS